MRLEDGKRILVWSCKPLHRVDFHTYIVKLVSVCDTIYQQKRPRSGLNSNADILLPKQSEASRASAHRSIHAKIKQVPNRTVSPTKPQTHEQPRFEQLLFSLFPVSRYRRGSGDAPASSWPSWRLLGDSAAGLIAAFRQRHRGMMRTQDSDSTFHGALLMWICCLHSQYGNLERGEFQD